MKIFYTVLAYLLTIIFNYLLGSISFSKIISSHYGVDITKVGSKNAGGTNVGRSVSKRAGILTITLDLLKCFLALLFTFVIFRYVKLDIFYYDQFIEVICSISAFSVALGHIYPVFSHFKGGKAVACFAGYCLFISPVLFLIGLLTFFITFKRFKKISLSSIIGSFSCLLFSFVPLITHLTCFKDYSLYNFGLYFSPSFMIHLTYVTTITVFLFILTILIRHSSNIKRLLAGKEPVTVFKKDVKKDADENENKIITIAINELKKEINDK